MAFKHFLYTNTNNLAFQKEPFTDQPINAWIVMDDASTYNCFNSMMKIRKRILILNRYRLLNNNYRIAPDGKYWSMLVNAINQEHISSKAMIGWISHEHIIVNDTPMRNLETNDSQDLDMPNRGAGLNRLNIYEHFLNHLTIPINE